MTNKFETGDCLPCQIFSGDQVSWEHSGLSATYPPGAFEMKYAFRLSSVTDAIEVVGQNVDGIFTFTMPGTLTQGHWSWTLTVTQSSDSRTLTLLSGVLIVHAQPNQADATSHARKMVTALEQELEARITGNGSANTGYSHEGRSLSRIEITDLRKLLSQYRHEANAELRRSRSGACKQSRLVRFN